jgi:hypothetical protein
MTEEERPSKEAVSSVLSFYSSQLTSHASMIVGFIVAFFTLIQVRGSIVGADAQWLLQLGALTIASATVYSMFRVVLYGSLSGVLTHSEVEVYRTFFTSQKMKLFEHGMVSWFASSQLKKTAPLRGRFYEIRGIESRRVGGRVNFWVQLPMVVSVAIAMLVVGVMFGWSPETFTEGFGLLILTVFALVILPVLVSWLWRSVVSLRKVIG